MTPPVGSSWRWTCCDQQMWPRRRGGTSGPGGLTRRPGDRSPRSRCSDAAGARGWSGATPRASAGPPSPRRREDRQRCCWSRRPEGLCHPAVRAQTVPLRRKTRRPSSASAAAGEPGTTGARAPASHRGKRGGQAGPSLCPARARRSAPPSRRRRGRSTISRPVGGGAARRGRSSPLEVTEVTARDASGAPRAPAEDTSACTRWGLLSSLFCNRSSFDTQSCPPACCS